MTHYAVEEPRRKRGHKVKRTSNPVAEVIARLDWPAYFRVFCEAHGTDGEPGWPVYYRGQLLFADGWRYSSTDHSGPEWPPPDDPGQLKELLTFYWKRRLAIVESERVKVATQLINQEQAQRGRNQPLQVTWTIREEMDDGRIVRRQAKGAATLDNLKARLSWLEGDVEKCVGKLLGLGVAVSQGPDGSLVLQGVEHV